MAERLNSKQNARRLRWAFLLLASAGCGTSSREEQAEFARLSHAIDSLRAAENAHKAQMIQPLRAAACRHFCELREKCVAAYEVHIRALDSIARARIQANLDVRELDAAELTLEKAKNLATECAAQQAELGRDFSP